MNLSNMDALSLILRDEKVTYAYNGAFNDEETEVISLSKAMMTWFWLLPFHISSKAFFA